MSAVAVGIDGQDIRKLLALGQRLDYIAFLV